MAQHAHRTHATWAASSTARHMACPGSLALALSLPGVARVEREAAAWGTCAHQISERCLRENIDADSFSGTTQTCGSFTFDVDEEMIETVQTYLDYCRGLMDRTRHFWIEENFDLVALDPPFDSGGTGDFVAYLPDEQLLEVVDLKGGKGVIVDVNENAQERTYALGAMLKHRDLKVRRVKNTIVQPRAPHPDGIIRSDEYHVTDLMEWTGDLLGAMHKANTALDALGQAQGNQVLRDEWRDEYLKPGTCCQFCPAEGVCPALRNDAMSIVEKWFEPETKEPLPNAMLDTSPEALAGDLDLMDRLTNWMNARRQYAQQLAESGTEIPNYILVEKRGYRRWRHDDGRSTEAHIALKIAEKTGLDADKLWNIKLMSPAQVEKLLPGVRKKQIAPLWETRINGTNLVRSDKTNRPAVGNIAQRFHDPNPMEN